MCCFCEDVFSLTSSPSCALGWSCRPSYLYPTTSKGDSRSSTDCCLELALDTSSDRPCQCNSRHLHQQAEAVPVFKTLELGTPKCGRRVSFAYSAYIKLYSHPKITPFQNQNGTQTANLLKQGNACCMEVGGKCRLFIPSKTVMYRRDLVASPNTRGIVSPHGIVSYSDK